jgi:nucleoside transporter
MSQLAAETSPVAATPPAVRRKLAGMMFLQYFMQGAYLTIVSMYMKNALHFTDDQIGWFMAAMGVGPVLAPFIVGQLVDRMYPTERVLAVCHLLGGVVMIAIYYQTQFVPVIVLGTIYSVLYVPTTMLTNSMAFHHLKNRDREFPMVRVCGTIGFIVPSWLILFYFLKGLEGDALNRAQGIAFVVAGVAGLVMAGYCLLLPHTPPVPRGSGQFAPGVVIRLMKRLDFAVLFAVSFVIAAVHNYFFVWNSPQVHELLDRHGWADRTQAFTTIGQITEILAMALLAPAIAKLGYKRTMVLGAIAYALRCVAFSQASSPDLGFGAGLALATFGQALHGFCFAFFLAAAFIYIDRAAPSDVKGSLQTIYGVFVLGMGFVVGGIWGGRMGDLFSHGPKGAKVYDWSPLWLWCAATAAICAVALALFFPRSTNASLDAEARA